MPEKSKLESEPSAKVAEPKLAPKPTKSAPLEPQKTQPFVRVAGIGLLCFGLSFLGAWTAIETGLIQSDGSITEKRNIVSQEGEVVADVAENVSPSVVSILTESQASLGLRSYTQQGAGTGIVISSDGYILTNKHVVDGASDLQIVLSDGTAYDDIEFVGSDPSNDIAFLKINGVEDLKPATIGDSSKVEVGEKVIAIGNALGQYQTTVTSGIVSGLGRPLVAGTGEEGETEQLSNLLQTDAAINPGNSGGPLVNLNGEVIGINTAIDEDAEGIGFAIPVNDTKGLIESVTKNGKVEKAYLGVTYNMVTADIAKRYNLNVESGAYLSNDDGDAVRPNSPAASAGLKEGDVILKVDGKELGATYPLQSAIGAHAPGDTVKVTYVRDGKETTIEVTLGAYPSS
ncbi:TPA: 2-alkenal reductase [Candidatus Saccharibacteria bacterium]|mgnify:FL=1|nr:2-alkenal reductase [Candidatus Saccharibacteria bacterium]HRK41390.1 trypsin-like peptidase domain-containing protein [Candidatus Saccharibacteria bacterium]